MIHCKENWNSDAPVILVGNDSGQSFQLTFTTDELKQIDYNLKETGSILYEMIDCYLNLSDKIQDYHWVD